MLFIDSWVSDGHRLARQAKAFVLAFHFSAVKNMSWAARHCRFPRFSCKDPLSSRLCHLLLFAPAIRLVILCSLTSSFLHVDFLFVLRLPLHAVPLEHLVLACWCQSRSPSWRGTCIDWHRTPAPLWPVPRPLDTLETLYPNSGPHQLLEKGKSVFYSHFSF